MENPNKFPNPVISLLFTHICLNKSNLKCNEYIYILLCKYSDYSSKKYSKAKFSRCHIPARTKHNQDSEHLSII